MINPTHIFYPTCFVPTAFTPALRVRGSLRDSVVKNTLSEISKKRYIIAVKSGTILQDLVNFSINHGLAGIERLTGIPGTVGGAIFGNAGAYGQTISDHLFKATAFDGKKISTLTKNQCGFDYRTSNFKANNLIILELTFKLPKQNPKILLNESQQVLNLRLAKYPAGIRCPGSFFKNVEAKYLTDKQLKKIPKEKITYGKIPAGYLLEMVKAKGQMLGKIKIAKYHGNLFVNTGGGTADDFFKLARKYAVKVYKKFDIKLEPEVQLINLPQIFK